MSRPQQQTLKDLFDWQIENLATVLRPGTIKAYRCKAKQFLAYLEKNWPNLRSPSQLRRDPHVLGWLRSLYEHQPPYANKSRMEMIIQVRRLLNDLLVCDHPPSEDLFVPGDCPPHDKYLPKPLSPEDDRQLQAQLSRQGGLRSQALLLMRATGIRIGECLQLTVDSLRKVAPDQWALRVPLGKLHSERWIPVDDDTRAIFNRILSLRVLATPPKGPGPSARLLLQKNGRPPSYWAVRNELINAARHAACSVQPTPHQLRHSFATEMLRAGASLPVVKELLGHRSIEMTLRYVQVSQVDLQREYYKARQMMGQLHLIPNITKPNADPGIPDILHLLTNIRHFMEMYRRQLNDNKRSRKLARLINRLFKISGELKALDAS